MENDIRCWMQNHLDLALRRINQNHIPHIMSSGKKMAVWSDVRETLFFWCMSPRCTVMLDVLKHHMRYPMSDASMHPCTPLEQALFVKQYVAVSVGTLLVDLAEIRKRTTLMVLYDMVKLKHRQSRDPRVRECNTLMMSIKDDYSQTAFKTPVAGSSSQNLVPGTRRMGKKALRGRTEYSCDMMVQGQGAMNAGSSMEHRPESETPSPSSAMVHGQEESATSIIEMNGDVIGSSYGQGKDVGKVSGDISRDGEGRRRDHGMIEIIQIDGEGRDDHAGEEMRGETEAASIDRADELESKDHAQSCTIITESEAPPQDRAVSVEYLVPSRVIPGEVLVPLTVLRELVIGDNRFLETVARHYVQGQCWEGLDSVTQCRVEEALHMTRFLACYRGYVWPWKCLTSNSLMMTWHEFCRGRQKFEHPVVLLHGLEVNLVVSNCAILTEVPERPKVKSPVKKEKSSGEVSASSSKTSPDKCVGTGRAESTGFSAIKTGQNHYTLHWNTSDASSNAVKCQDKFKTNKIPRNHTGVGSKCMKNKKTKVVPISKSDSSLLEMKKRPQSKCQSLHKQEANQVARQKNMERDVPLHKNVIHSTSNGRFTSKGKIRGVNEQKNKLNDRPTNKIDISKESTDSGSVSSRLDNCRKNAVCKDNERPYQRKKENTDNKTSKKMQPIPKSNVRTGACSNKHLTENVEIPCEDGITVIDIETVDLTTSKDLRKVKGSSTASIETVKQCIDILESTTKGSCSPNDDNISPVRQWTDGDEGASGEDINRSVSGMNNVRNASRNGYMENNSKRPHLKMASPQICDAFPGSSKTKSAVPIKSLLHSPTIQTLTRTKYHAKPAATQSRSTAERFMYNVQTRRWEIVEKGDDWDKCPQLGLYTVQQSDAQGSQTCNSRVSSAAGTSTSDKGMDFQNNLALDDFRTASAEGNYSSSAKTDSMPPSKGVTVSVLQLTKGAEDTITNQNGVNTAVNKVNSGSRQQIVGKSYPTILRQAESAILSPPVDVSTKGNSRLGAFKSDSCIPGRLSGGLPGGLPGGAVKGKNISMASRVINPIDIPRSIDGSKPFIAIRSSTIPTPKPTKVNTPVSTPRSEKKDGFIVSLKGVTKYGSSSSDRPDIYDKFARKTKVLKPVIQPSRKSNQSPRKSCTQDATQNCLEAGFPSSTNAKKTCTISHQNEIGFPSSTNAKKTCNFSHQNDNSSSVNKCQVSNLNRLQCKHSANVQGREATWKRIMTSQQPSTSHWSPAISRVLVNTELTSCTVSRYDQPAFSDLSIANEPHTTHDVFKEVLQKVRDRQSQATATPGVHPAKIKSDYSLRPSASLESIDSLTALAVMKPIKVPGVPKEINIDSKDNLSPAEASKASNRNLNCKVIYNCPDCFKRKSFSNPESKCCHSIHKPSTESNKDTGKEFRKVDSKLYFSNGRSFHELQPDSFIPSGAQFYIKTNGADNPQTTRQLENENIATISIASNNLGDLPVASDEADLHRQSENITQMEDNEIKHNSSDDFLADINFTRSVLSHTDIDIQSEKLESNNSNLCACEETSQCAKSAINELEKELPAGSSSTIVGKAKETVSSIPDKHEGTAICKIKANRPGRKSKNKLNTVCIEEASRKQTLRNRKAPVSYQNSENSDRQERYQRRNKTKSRDGAASSEKEIYFKSEHTQMSSGCKKGCTGRKLGRKGRPKKSTVIQKKMSLRSKQGEQQTVVAAYGEQHTSFTDREAGVELNHESEPCSQSRSVEQIEPKEMVEHVKEGAIDKNSVSGCVRDECCSRTIEVQNSTDNCDEAANVIFIDAETDPSENVDHEELWPEQIIEEPYTVVETYYDNTNGGIDAQGSESAPDIFYDSCNEDEHAQTQGYSYEGLDTNYVVVYDDLTGLPDMSNKYGYIQDEIEVKTTPIEDHGMVSTEDCYSENCDWLETNQDFRMDATVSEIHPMSSECKCETIESQLGKNISKAYEDVQSGYSVYKCDFEGYMQDQSEEEEKAGLRQVSSCRLMECGSCDVENCSLGWPVDSDMKSSDANTGPGKLHKSGKISTCKKTPAVSSVSNDTSVRYDTTFERSEKLSRPAEHICEKKIQLNGSKSENNVTVSRQYTQSCCDHLVMEETQSKDRSDEFTHGSNIFEVLQEELDKTRCAANDSNRTSKMSPMHEQFSEGVVSGLCCKPSNRESGLIKQQQSNTHKYSHTKKSANISGDIEGTIRNKASVSKKDISKKFSDMDRPEPDKKSRSSNGKEKYAEKSNLSDDVIIINDDVIVIDDDHYDGSSNVQSTQAAKDAVPKARNAINNGEKQKAKSETELKSSNNQKSNSKLVKAWESLSKKIKSRNNETSSSTKSAKACKSKKVNPHGCKSVNKDSVKDIKASKDHSTNKHLKKSNHVRESKLACKTNAEMSCIKENPVVGKEEKKSSMIRNKHDKKIMTLPKTNPMDNQKKGNNGLEENNSNRSLATSVQNEKWGNSVENCIKLEDEAIDSESAGSLLNSDDGKQTTVSQKHQKKKTLPKSNRMDSQKERNNRLEENTSNRSLASSVQNSVEIHIKLEDEPIDSSSAGSLLNSDNGKQTTVSQKHQKKKTLPKSNRMDNQKERNNRLEENNSNMSLASSVKNSVENCIKLEDDHNAFDSASAGSLLNLDNGKHQKKNTLPKTNRMDNRKENNNGLEEKWSLASSVQNSVEIHIKLEDEPIDSSSSGSLLTSDDGKQTATSQKHQKKRKSSKLHTTKDTQDDEEDVDNKEMQARRASENFIRKQQMYMDILASSSKEASPHRKSVCLESRDPVVAETDVPSGVPVLGDRVITKALADAERALEGTGSLEDSDNEEDAVILRDMATNYKYQLVSDEDGINLGGVAYLLDHELPFVYVNGYKFCPVRDVLMLFQPRCCPTRCMLPRKILQNHRGLVKSYSTWEQVYKFGLIKMSKGPAVVTGDLLVKLDSLVSLLPELSADIVAVHINTTYKWSQNCNVQGYTSFMKS